MTDAWLRENPPARSQYRSPRRARPTGLTVVHTAEGVLDTIGPDTGAENTARFIRDRSEPGSYHDLVDSDSALYLVRYGDEAYQDGTGSNPFALSISFALKTSDWRRLTPARRDAFLEQGAVAFRRQQQWLAAHRHPLTPLVRVSRAQSDAGHAGFISHGERDPARRSDPGADFPWARFFAICADQEDDMPDPADLWNHPLKHGDVDAPAARRVVDTFDLTLQANRKLDVVLGLLADDAASNARLEDKLAAALAAGGSDITAADLARELLIQLGGNQ